MQHRQFITHNAKKTCKKNIPSCFWVIATKCVLHWPHPPRLSSTITGCHERHFNWGPSKGPMASSGWKEDLAESAEQNLPTPRKPIEIQPQKKGLRKLFFSTTDQNSKLSWLEQKGENIMVNLRLKSGGDNEITELIRTRKAPIVCVVLSPRFSKETAMTIDGCQDRQGCEGWNRNR